MAYIQVGQSVVTHRKTLRLARLLGMDRYQVVGRLVSFWSWCLDNAPRGCLKDIESDILADVLDYRGSSGDLVESLIAAGFLDVAEDGELWVHGWDETMLPYIERKEKNAARMRETRAREREQSDDSETSASDGARATHVQRTFTARADVEKKREEESISDPTVDTSGGDTTRERMAPVACSAQAAPTRGALALSVSPSPAQSTQPQTPTRTPANIVPLPLTPPAAQPRAQPSRQSRSPDPLWDACVAACDGDGNGPSNNVERGKWNKGLSALRQSGATPEEIAIRAERYRRRYGPDIALNPMALASNWTVLVKDISQEGTHHAANSRISAGSSGSSSAARRSTGSGGWRDGRRSTLPADNLPDADELREWARRQQALGVNVSGL